jgi:hypothetical protein
MPTHAANETTETTWRAACARGIRSGAVASVLSAAALALGGARERGSAAWPLNGPSQWLWGRHAAHRSRPTLRHTVVGYAIHHAMSTAWAIVHEKLAGRPERVRPLRELGRGGATAALACFVDYRLTPRRLEPGFDVPLSRPSMLGAYAAFAIGLAASRCVRRD